MWTYQHPQFLVHQIAVLNDNYLYVIETEHDLIAIDPAVDQAVIDLSKQCNKPLRFILNTHHHWDHTDGNLTLKKHFNCHVIASSYDAHRTPGIDQEAKPHIHISGLSIQVLDVPGHTLGHIVYLIENALFCGDTLFGAGCGRLFEGTPDMMWSSLKKIAQLKDETHIYCAHEYTLMNLKFARTIDQQNPSLKQRIHDNTQQRMQKQPTIPSLLGLEKKTNPFLRPLNRDFCQSYACQHQIKPESATVFAHIRQRRNCYS